MGKSMRGLPQISIKFATVALCQESIVMLPIPKATTSLDVQQPIPMTGMAGLMIASLTLEMLTAISFVTLL